MADSFTHILGDQRGRGINIGDSLQGERLERLAEAARSGQLDAAHGVWRRDQYISEEERDYLFENISQGAISRVSDELDLEIHWRRVLTSTGLWQDKTDLIKFGPGNLLHICPDGQTALCGASQNIHAAPRGSWAEPAHRGHRCFQCEEESDQISSMAETAIEERRALVPLGEEEIEAFQRELFSRVDFYGDQLEVELKRQMLSLLQEKLAEVLSEDSARTLAVMHKQMLRTSSFEIRKRLWQLHGVKSLDQLSQDDWMSVSRFVLSASAFNQVVWAGICQTMSNKQTEHPIWKEIKRTIITPFVIRPSRAERQESKRVAQEIRERRRAGW